MGKAIVFSILVATIVIPIRYARENRKKRGLRKALLAFGVFAVLWTFATLFIAPHL